MLKTTFTTYSANLRHQRNFCKCCYGEAIKDNFTIYNANLNLDVITISDKCYDDILCNSNMEAAKCNNCGQCAYECSQGIDIPNEYGKIAMYFTSNKAAFEWH